MLLMSKAAGPGAQECDPHEMVSGIYPRLVEFSVASFQCSCQCYMNHVWSRGQNLKKIVLLHPLGRKTPLLPCIRYTSMVLGKPCFTKLSVVSFS